MKLRACAGPRRHLEAKLHLEVLEYRAVPAILTEGHVDIGMAYDGVAWDLHVHDETNDVEYEPGEALLYLPRNTRAMQPTNPDYAFIGAGAGNPIWLLPQVQEPEKMLLGIGAEEIAPGTFASYFEADRRVQGEGEWIRLDLIDVQGPVGGEMAVWQTDSFGKVINWMSTHTNRPPDTAFTLAGEHGDYNWAFTAKGIYEVSFRASAYLGPGMTNKTESDVVSYFFGVEDTGGFTPAPGAPNRPVDGINTSPSTHGVLPEVLPARTDPHTSVLLASSSRRGTDLPQFVELIALTHADETVVPRSEGRTWASLDESSEALSEVNLDLFAF